MTCAPRALLQVRALLEANKPVRDAEWSIKEVECIMEKLPQVGGGRSGQVAGRQCQDVHCAMLLVLCQHDAGIA